MALKKIKFHFFLSILKQMKIHFIFNQMEIHLVQNLNEIGHHDHIPFNFVRKWKYSFRRTSPERTTTIAIPYCSLFIKKTLHMERKNNVAITIIRFLFRDSQVL